MPSTAHGWPYPDGSAKIADLGVKIQDLAAAIERRLQGGKVNFPSANGAASIAVVFPVAYVNTPMVTLGHNGSSTTAWYYNGKTNTGMTILINRVAISAPQVEWIGLDIT